MTLSLIACGNGAQTPRAGAKHSNDAGVTSARERDAQTPDAAPSTSARSNTRS